MTTLAITVNVTNPDEEDRRAMNMIIDQENVHRVSLGQSVLPNSTAAERKSSYEIALVRILGAAHAGYIQAAGDAVLFSQVRDLWKLATDAKRNAAIAALQ